MVKTCGFGLVEGGVWKARIKKTKQQNSIQDLLLVCKESLLT